MAVIALGWDTGCTMIRILGPRVIILVAVDAKAWSPGISTACMALGTFGIDMFPNKREAGQAMIKSRLIPVIRIVTHQAVLREG